MTKDELTAGTSYYDGKDTFYFRGDGIQINVLLPAGKDVVSISPATGYTGTIRKVDSGVFQFSATVPNKLLVTMTLKDTE